MTGYWVELLDQAKFYYGVINSYWIPTQVWNCTFNVFATHISDEGCNCHYIEYEGHICLHINY